uniref:Uncharacterized protein n=1 Tax=Oryza sativa subsp. japonica TaxID=39947 RepID=Q6K690_ORYSJ|nr:hypothetical protein [Oryza sativa Japonica Group]BAD19652.1 hypothetical protein [Oryza sativa Japonica Group]
MAGQAGTCPVAAAAKTAIRLAPPHANQVYLTGARDYPSPAQVSRFDLACILLCAGFPAPEPDSSCIEATVQRDSPANIVQAAGQTSQAARPAIIHHYDCRNTSTNVLLQGCTPTPLD